MRQKIANRFRPTHSRIGLVFTGMTFVWWLITGLAVGQDSADPQLRNYLDSLKLTRLVVAHLELELGAAIDPNERTQLARQLIDRYTEQMLNAEAGQHTSNDFAAKANQLMQRQPELASPRLSVALLQSRFLNLEQRFHNFQNPIDWTATNADSIATSPIASTPLASQQLTEWLQLERDLHQLNQQLQDRYQELVTTLQTHGNDVTLSSELGQTELLLLHSHYLLGWTNYFCGILDTNQPKKWFRKSDQQFREYFQLDARQSLTEISAKWFNFNSGWQTQGLIGMALCQLGLQHPQQSQHCFDLIEQHGTGNARVFLPVWRLNAELHLRHFDTALRMIRKFETEHFTANVEQVTFWQTVLGAAPLVTNMSPALGEQFELAGLAGLVRNKQAPLLEAYLRQTRSSTDTVTELPATSGMQPTKTFISQWTRGYLEFVRYQSAVATDGKTNHNISSGSTLKFARQALETAIAAADAQIPIIDLAHCRFLLGQIELQERNFAAAADRFNQVAITVASLDRDLAAESQFLAAQALMELSRIENRHSAAAYSALENLIRKFPETKFASRAEFEKLRLNLQPLPPTEAIRRLQRIKPADANYVLALTELTRQHFQLWLDSQQTNDPNQNGLLLDLELAVEAVHQQPAASLAQRLNARLLFVDALLRTKPADAKRTQLALAQAADIGRRLRTQTAARGNGNPIEFESELHFYQFRFAEQQHDFDAAKTEAQWIVTNAAGSRFELAALVFLGQRLTTNNHDDNDHAGNNAATKKIFTRLVEVLGSTADQLSQNKNAQVALSKLADLELRTQNWSAAAEHYQQLLAVFPNERVYVRGLALAQFQMANYQQAALFWNQLGAGANAGSDDWLEAKHKLIECLRESDPQSAQAVFQQTIRLAGDLPAAWRLQFEELQTKVFERQ